MKVSIMTIIDGAIRSFCVLSVLWLTACGDGTSTSENAAKAVETEADSIVNSTVLKRSGRVVLVDVPSEGNTAIEVLAVTKLEDETLRKVKRQRELFERMLLGQPEETADDLELPEADLATFKGQLDALKPKFPPIFSKELNVGGGRMVRFTSEMKRHQDYAYLFGAISLDNIDRALPILKEKVEATNRELVERGNLAEGEALYQVQIELEWVGKLATLLGEYIRLGNSYLTAKTEYAEAFLKTHSNEPMNWRDFAAYYRATLFVEVSQHSTGATVVEEDGSFEVEGEGFLLVRLEYGLDSAYFIMSEEETRVQIEEGP